MIANRYVTLSVLHRGTALVVLLAVVMVLWLSIQPTAEGRLTDGVVPDVVELAAPAGLAVSASKDNPDTAFREDQAGFSGYYRFTDPEGDPVTLNVYGITESLLLKPDESNSVRAQLAGSAVDIGTNFGIVTLPMVAAVGVVVPPRDVTVYYDDQGWIVAYLACEPPPNDQNEPTCDPAAAIWKHDPTDDELPRKELGNNLLVLAINEVIGAHNEDLPEADRLAKVSHNGDDDGNNKVKYYDWQNGACNAFVMFSTTSDGGESDPVNFVVPHTIKTEEIHASAAALITRQQAEGAETLAATLVDDAISVFALADRMLDASSFTLEREAGETSLHSMSVSVDEGESAAGAVMLLYKRPS